MIPSLTGAYLDPIGGPASSRPLDRPPFWKICGSTTPRVSHPFYHPGMPMAVQIGNRESITTHQAVPTKLLKQAKHEAAVDSAR